MKIISEAPCRVDLAGGTLDIWPLYLFHPGAVTLNFAINRWTRCVLETQESPEIRLRSGDLEAEETFASFDELARAIVLRCFPNEVHAQPAQLRQHGRYRYAAQLHTRQNIDVFGN